MKYKLSEALGTPVDTLEGHRLAVSSIDCAIIECKRHLHRHQPVSTLASAFRVQGDTSCQRSLKACLLVRGQQRRCKLSDIRKACA